MMMRCEPQTLDRAGIAARIPHAGSMCLLEALEGWSEAGIRCRASRHRDADHPLRSAGGLLAPAAIEYAAQAMALHGALLAPAGAPPTPGALASVRGVRLHVERLDGLAGDLLVQADRLVGDERQILYRFSVVCAGEAPQPVADGRATVVLQLLTSRTP
jgi:predicted hotdog family 3-hydroxylacyl-ACP dehydratase